MNKLILIFAVGSLLLYGCGNSSSTKSNTQTEVAIQKEHHHDDESEIIELNDGEKWVVDSDMLVHIKNMEKDVISFGQNDQKDYKALAKKLQSNIDLLTSSCTMTGKAHDELHKWLLPYIEMVKVLSDAKDETETVKRFKNIQSSFSRFNTYFL